MILQQLNIKKFRAVENVSFTFIDGVNALGGKNGTGKTTIVDSILWMLADDTLICGGDNSKNIDDNKPNDPLEVEAIFQKADNSILKLKRVYKAVYKEDGTFNKFANDFFINDASYTVKDYFARICREIGLQDYEVKGFNTLRALIDFNYFSSIDYKIARKKLELILKLENDANILSQEKYRPIVQELQAVEFDVAKCKTTFNKQKTIANNDIDRKLETIQTLEKNNKPVDADALKSLKDKLEEIKKKEFQHTIEYTTSKEDRQKFADRVNETYNNLVKVKKEYDLTEIQKNNVLNNIETKTRDLKELQKKFIDVKNSVRKCPNCNFELNADDVKAKLSEIATMGKQLQQELKNIDKTASENNYKDALAKYQTANEEHKKALEDQQKFIQAQAELVEKEDAMAKTFYEKKQETIAEFQKQIQEIENQNNDAVINQLKEGLNTDREKLALIELKLELLDEFEKEKITAIQTKTELVFPGIEFKLLEYSNAGAEIKTCKATYKNVDYAKLNDAQKIKLGIEIIDDLKRAFGILDGLPIVFDKFRDLDNDNIKSLRNITKSQIFTTYVSKDDNITLFNC